jgi:hypothetical protein
MFTPRGLAPLSTAALISLVALASGCGSGSSAFSTTETATAPTAAAGATSTTATVAPAPKGRLTAGEYSVFLRATKLGQRNRHVKDPQRVVAVVQDACKILDHGPATRLVLEERTACPRELRWVQSVLAFETGAAGCRAAAAAGDISCYAELYSRVARTTRTLIVSARAVNALMHARGLKGACAQAIGVASQKDLATATATAHDARVASQALYARDLPGFLSVNKRFAAELKTMASGDSGNDVKKMRSCPHD